MKKPQVSTIRRLFGIDVDRLDLLAGDGSTREYYRVGSKSENYILQSGDNKDENTAWNRIAHHLDFCGVRVPAIYGYDEKEGLTLMEDLGDVSLSAMLARAQNDYERFVLYQQVLPLLGKIQLSASQDFGLDICFGKTPYDASLMINLEGLYFVEEFAAGAVGLKVDAASVKRELEAAISSLPPMGWNYFLHRDFQSRNIFLKRDEWVLIDFQGARPGPLAYDAAALILDPYAGNSPTLRALLLNDYLALLARHDPAMAAQVKGSWGVIGAFRLMQALGAYGKLGWRLKKPGFLEHAQKALVNLKDQLEEIDHELPVLRKLVDDCHAKWPTILEKTNVRI